VPDRSLVNPTKRRVVSSAWGRQVRALVPSTLRDNGAQRALETFQFIKLRMDVSNVVFGDALHLPTCHVPISSEAKKRAHVLKGESQFACPSDEEQVPLIFFGVEPVSARATRRIWQDTDAFEVANGLDVHLGSLGQRADGH
jgi:hypothetical protein